MAQGREWPGTGSGPGQGVAQAREWPGTGSGPEQEQGVTLDRVAWGKEWPRPGSGPGIN